MLLQGQNSDREMKNQRTNEITAEYEKLAQDWEKFAEAEGKTYQALAKLGQVRSGDFSR
jgi:hypothetical protein